MRLDGAEEEHVVCVRFQMNIQKKIILFGQDGKTHFPTGVRQEAEGIYMLCCTPSGL